MSCHNGIEQAHPEIAQGQCTICHGGDGSKEEKETAHVAVPANWAEIRGSALPPAPNGFIKDFAPDQLAAIDPNYVRFVNPGDIRALPQTCGVTDCHPDKARSLLSSVMTTNAGHYFPSLYLADLQEERIAEFGSFSVEDPDCDPQIPGTVCEMTTLVPPEADEIRTTIQSQDPKALELLATKHYLAKNCNTCHQAGYPRNNSPGLYRSSGCTACHMVYSDEGVYEGGDPSIPKGSPVHAKKHEITTAIPTEQCGHCHFQGGRIGLLYRGIREGGFKEAPPNAEPINQTLYGHAPGYYFTDEDTTNAVDETPPDVHFSAGMHCADCHVGSDVHGDGRLYSSSKLQLDLRCEDCHGTIREEIRADAQGRYLTQKGRHLPQLSEGEGGTVVLTGVMDGKKHVVPQVAKHLQGTPSMRFVRAMGEDENGWSHTDSLTCDTCHTSYNQFCVGCHVSLDLRLNQVDYQTGRSTPGLTRGGRTTYTLNQILLGTAPDGRVQSVHPSQQLQLNIVGAMEYGTEDGALLKGGQVPDGNGGMKTLGDFRSRDFSTANNGFVPFFQHTTSTVPRTCADCHRIDDSPEEMARIRGVYGFGSGEFMLPSPDGRLVDGLQFLDEMGQPTTTWVHPGTGPVVQEKLQKALDVIVGDER